MQSEEIIKQLVEEFGYKPVPPMFSEINKVIFRNELPNSLVEEGDGSVILYDMAGVMICHGYTRIVVGDYGAFIEFSEEQAAVCNFMIKPGQEFRATQEQYLAREKYIWLTTQNGSFPKIYKQLRTVPYADYLPGMYYVSPFEVQLKKN